MDAPSYRLNAMQALMRRFAELAPYNFIHAMRGAGPARADRWREVATQTLAELHLGAPQFEGDDVCFSSTIPAVIEAPSSDLDTHLATELNRPFPRGEAPLRFFVIGEPDDTHWFGIVLDHWLADDHSCRQLMHRFFLRYHSPGSADTLPPLRFAGAVDSGSLLSALPTLIRQIAEHRRAFRVSLGDPQDFAVSTFQHRLPDGLIQIIQQRAKERAATVHDFFLAACAQACGEFSRRQMHGHRTAVGIATVADLRGTLGCSENTFGCLLSYYTTVVDRQEDVSADGLLQSITARTRQSKKSLRTTVAALPLARFWWDRTRSTRGKATLFQRSMPNFCGLSNVNLIGSWIDQAPPALRDYRRVGPTGPIAPLVFLLTSRADRLVAEVTYRTTAFTQGDAELLANRFSHHLQALA
ncbi:MAG TPA: hypothetical protein VK961_03325 [Chthoniobacter sp.]|nr:hypothetical protein [Chthoniobacter sp.]